MFRAILGVRIPLLFTAKMGLESMTPNFTSPHLFNATKAVVGSSVSETAKWLDHGLVMMKRGFSCNISQVVRATGWGHILG